MNRDELLIELHRMQIEIDRLKHLEIGPQWIYLAAPLTSTDWDGDARSTTAKTLIDLSTVFGVPANVKAIDVRAIVNDSGSAATDCYLILGPTDVNFRGKAWRPEGRANDKHEDHSDIVPCDGNGDIYYQIAATGVGTFDVFIEIWGYAL